MIVNQKILWPHRSMTSFMKSGLGKNEYMTIQANITMDEPRIITQVITVQL